MSGTGILLSFIIFIVAFIAIMFVIGYSGYFLLRLVGFAPSSKSVKAKPVRDEKLEWYLHQHFPYFKKLSAADQKKFMGRMLVFLKHKKIIGRSDFVIDETHRQMVAAVAVQLTMGQDDFMLEDFHTILLYADNFESVFGGERRGETSSKGVIALSWKYFMEGIREENKQHLGLHEFAHALMLNGIRKGMHDEFVFHFMPKWRALTASRINKIRSGENKFFRSYAGVNPEELFAVCTEYFFLTPEAFSEHDPELYRWLCVIYNQDPSARPQIRFHLRKELIDQIPMKENSEPLFSCRGALDFVFDKLGIFIIVFIIISCFLVFSGASGSRFLMGFVVLGFAVMLVTIIPVMRRSHWTGFYESGLVQHPRIFFYRKKNYPWELVASVYLLWLSDDKWMGSNGYYEMEITTLNPYGAEIIKEPVLTLKEDQYENFRTMLSQNNVRLRVKGGPLAETMQSGKTVTARQRRR